MLRLRKALSEHPFGTIKVAMNHERLLLKGLKHVATEIKLTVLSYNFKRVMSIMGVPTMIEKLQQGPNEPLVMDLLTRQDAATLRYAFPGAMVQGVAEVMGQQVTQQLRGGTEK